MRKLLLSILVCLTAGMAAAAVTTFSPTPGDMYDLDHYRYYEWGVNLGFSTADTPIQDAVLSFDNITNWDNNGNVLYIHLLDLSQNPDSWSHGTLLEFRDSNTNLSDAFAGQGVLVAQWHDTNGSAATNDLEFRFSQIPGLLDALNSYGRDGYIAFGLDPDCHYWNDGVKFTVTTATVPAPGAVALGSIGLALVGWLRTRKTL